MWFHQTAQPDPPVAYIPNLHASLHWKALLSGRLVGDFQIDDPKIHFDLRQFVQEAKDPTPMKDKGWQDALQAAYPLKIDRFAIRNGDLTYVDKGFKPLHVTGLNFTTENIRNVESEKGVYPSPVYLEGVVFDKGRAKFEGHADFLAKPHIALKGNLQLDQIALDYFKPIAERYKLSIRSGYISTARGSIEYAPDIQKILISDLSFTGLDADYLHQETQTSPTEKVTKQAGKVARKTANEPTLEVKVERFTGDGQIGFVDQTAKPPYKVFLAGTKLQLENLSNHVKDGPARARVTGKFMGSGSTQAQATFRPESKGPDLDLVLSIENTDMLTMNDLFRAYGNFDVVAGSFPCIQKSKYGKGRLRDMSNLFSEI